MQHFTSTTILLLFTIFSLQLQSCTSSKEAKRLKQHRTLLNDMVNDKSIEPETKIDALGTSLVKMMHHSLDFGNPKKGAVFIQKYSEQNSENIDLLFKEISAWQKDLSTFEKIALGASMLQKSYVTDLVKLIPRIEAKYRQYKMVMDLTNKLKGGLQSVGGKAIGL